MKSLTGILMVLAVAIPSKGGEIGYVEDFALADERPQALKQLIPGTRDYYYYHCLHLQHTEQFGKVEPLLKLWIGRYKHTSRVWEIMNRQALLTYDQTPQKTLDHIRNRLGLHFNHQRESLGGKANLPTSLDQNLISRATLMKIALSHYRDVSGFELSSHDWLIKTDLDGYRRRHLLRLLQRPDHANLAQLVVADLKYKNSRTFGSHPIHKQLMIDQLEQVIKLDPRLLNHSAFVYTYLSKLRPNDDVNWQNDPAVYKAYLDRQWAFVSRLNPNFNSLKVSVLYHRLAFDRTQGLYDKDRFMTYLKLPRNASYINSDYIRRADLRRFVANLNQNYQKHTALPPIRSDESLVRSYLHHYFIKETAVKPYETYIERTYLQHRLAEAKIVNGLGDPEKWYSLLPPATYKALKERIDLQFSHANKKWFTADQVVELDLDVKNVKTLLVKVFRINERNFYRDKNSEVSTAINLDGLVANHQSTHKYDLAQVRRVRRHFTFPQLKEPGTYVIDFIGNGRNSRVLVRKGRLRYLVRTSSAGHVFTVLDESNRKQPKARILMAGRTYTADKDGDVTIPFSNKPTRQSITLISGDRVTLDSFQHRNESYQLSAGIYVDRETLLRRNRATVVVRPGLYLNGTPITLSILEDVKLVIGSVDQDGVRSTKVVDNFKLFEDRESVYELATPKRLAQIHFAVTAKVKNLSQAKKISLSSSASFSLNGIDRTEKTEDLHFAGIDGGYVIDLLGKTGEPKAARPIQLQIKHRDFKRTVSRTLQTDRAGRVDLGVLKDVIWVRATGPQGTSQTFRVPSDQHSYNRAVHGRVGQTITMPYMGGLNKADRGELSLIEMRGSTFVADRFDVLSVKNGQLTIGKLPRGDYDLQYKPVGPRIRIRIADGEIRDGYVLSTNRQLEVKDDRPLQIQSINTDKKNVTIQLLNATKFSRVHIFATRFAPAYSAYRHFSAVGEPDPYVVSVPWMPSAYMEGRDIGDEYRYILDRRYTTKYPGNMLKRPSLLLNPWAIRKTSTGHQRAAAGQPAFGSATGSGTGISAGHHGRGGNIRTQPIFGNLDFLATGSVVLLNQLPDKDGKLQIKRDLLGAHQSIHVVAVDPRQTAYRTISLPEVQADYVDLRLAAGLEPKAHFTRQKRITIVPNNGVFEIADLTTSRHETYDTIARLYSLYSTLNPHPHIKEFSFIVGWPKLKAEQKRSLYSKYACHELNFFLFKKDPVFFKGAVAPYLANKKDKTFLDRWLLDQATAADLKPWTFGRLNTVERVLLSRRLGGEQLNTSRYLREQFELLPPNPDRFNRLFRTALQGRALEAAATARDEMERDSSKLFKAKESLELNDDMALSAPGAAPKAPSVTRRRGQSQSAANKVMEKKMRQLKTELSESAKDQKALVGRIAGKSGAFRKKDADKRSISRQFYRKLDKTQEWVENNYYHLPIEQQLADLVRVNAFWVDFANHDPAKPFHSKHVAEATNSFTEMMLALSILDIPFEAGKHQEKVAGRKLSLKAANDLIVFHEEIRSAKVPEGKTPILVSQNFFRDNDRFEMINGERVDKFITDEFVIHTVYGCRVVVTNPTSSRQKLDVLLQVPVGAMPVRNGKYTRSVYTDLQPYATRNIEYFFYFPAAGKAAHYPVHVAKDENAVAFADPFVLNVVPAATKIDRASWQYVSQHGTNADVVQYLNTHNIGQLNLAKIAFRMKDKGFFKTATDLIAKRHAYNGTLWSYGILHNQLPAINQFLQHHPGFIAQCGSFIESKPLTINPVARHMYQHRDYAPLVNARAHQLGKRRKIVNDRFTGQYHELMKVFTYKRDLGNDDLMAVTYYMLLQDRIEEAMGYFKRVNAQKLTTQIQYDYFAAYLDMFSAEPKIARAIAARYAEHPVDRWRNVFAAVTSQLDEIEGKNLRLVDGEDRGQQQALLASTAPNLEFKVEANQIKVNYQNLETATINYYLMDVELLFSRNPFVQKHSGQFAYIRPNRSQTVKLPKGKSATSIALPAEYHAANVLVEIVAGGRAKSHAAYANTLRLQLIENYGQAVVRNSVNAKPLKATYFKVYARMKDGSIRFYKDGYTDLRGRIDYTSLNTNELDNVDRFSLLIASQKHGTVVREVAPPKR